MKRLALPHAMIVWPGDFCVVLGRSQAGVDYGATGGNLHLIVLLVVGKGRERMHLELLAAVAELLNDDEFRQDLANARDVRDIKQLLVVLTRPAAHFRAVFPEQEKQATTSIPPAVIWPVGRRCCWLLCTT